MGGGDLRTLVLVGKTRNGKSATGNSIIGNNKFCLNRCSSGGTTTSKLEISVLEDGQMLNVIDTPALFGSSVDFETSGKEIVRCIKMAVEGIHAVLLVYSVCNYFSDEEKAAISILQDLFGKKICDYMILVFTCGDELEEDNKTLEEIICECPQALKEILSLCGNRFVLFDNKTKDETKKANQVQQLLSLVNYVVEKNCGEPYTNETFIETKKQTRCLKEQTEEFQVLKETKGHLAKQTLRRVKKMHVEVEQMNPVVKMFDEEYSEEERLKYKQELEEELEAANRMRLARRKTEEDIQRMRKELQEAEKEMKKSLQTNEPRGRSWRRDERN